AEEIRKLAEESSRAARAATVTVARLRDDIDGAARAIAAGKQAVRDVGAIATEATAAVGQVLTGVEQLRRVTDETAAAAQSHRTAVREASTATGAAQRSLDGIGAHVRDIILAVQRQRGLLGSGQGSAPAATAEAVVAQRAHEIPATGRVERRALAHRPS